ncbi:MAG: hypothetical protein ACOZNI_30135 [Myxococcota bacterium]
MILQAIVAVVLGLAWLWLSIVNWLALIRQISGTCPVSWVPAIGGALGAAAAMIEPSGFVSPYWWLAFALDGGSLPGFTVSLILGLKRLLRGRKEPH